MSLPQLSTALKRQPSLEKLSQPNRPYTHFIYDFPVQFKKQFPTAAPMGVGLIATWEFHVNQKGRANIRPAFETKLAGYQPFKPEYLLPVPGLKRKVFDGSQPRPVYGIIFNVSKQDDEIIERGYLQQKQSRPRIWFRAWMSKTGEFTKESPVVPVSMFADLRHTCNYYSPGTLMSAVELQRWKETLAVFGRYGVPEWYRKFVGAEVQGQRASKISPIFIEPTAYPHHVPRTQIPKPRGAKLEKEPLAPTVVALQKKYHKKHGKLAPPCPGNSIQARVFEEYHDELMRGQVDIDIEHSAHLKGTVNYWDRISDRCDDGLDVFDALRASRGQRPWKHPNIVDGPIEGVDEIQAAVQVTLQQPASNVVSRKPSTTVKRKEPPQNTQVPCPNGPPPAKKQKVQQPKAAAAVPRNPQNMQ
ncbi:hypothetical protein DL95DRAFT_400965 [Leptodontidium sp. 2 PMI_412]|nr:hypothetical protein DL95DRAFT_400965 [Leptodontidium sp. 2 PMI_412]